VEVADGKIARIAVVRGAPCGATWDAAAGVLGHPVEEAMVRIGLETQFFCTANPAGWDPLYGKSPVHFAGDVHAAALKKALGRE
jgi:thymidylate synthase